MRLADYEKQVLRKFEARASRPSDFMRQSVRIFCGGGDGRKTFTAAEFADRLLTKLGVLITPKIAKAFAKNGPVQVHLIELG